MPELRPERNLPQKHENQKTLREPSNSPKTFIRSKDPLELQFVFATNTTNSHQKALLYFQKVQSLPLHQKVLSSARPQFWKSELIPFEQDPKAKIQIH